MLCFPAGLTKLGIKSMESDTGKSEFYKSLVNSGFEEQVAEEIDALHTSGAFARLSVSPLVRERLIIIK